MWETSLPLNTVQCKLWKYSVNLFITNSNKIEAFTKSALQKTPYLAGQVSLISQHKIYQALKDFQISRLNLLDKYLSDFMRVKQWEGQLSVPNSWRTIDPLLSKKLLQRAEKYVFYSIK